MTFSIHNLRARADSELILKGVALTVRGGEIHAIMGPNGSGKSTLAKVIMGHPGYAVTKGRVVFNGKNILSLAPDERSRAGVFLAFQYPLEVPGVNMFSYLRAIYSARFHPRTLKKPSPGVVRHRAETEAGIGVDEFRAILSPILKKLRVKEEFLERSVNEGFSGGEKKKAEIIQLAVLQPSVIILDETDSGLDVDALKVVSLGICEFRPPDSAVLIITHYQRILRYIKPDFVHVMVEGKIVESGGYELARRVEKKGYQGINSKVQMSNVKSSQKSK